MSNFKMDFKDIHIGRLLSKMIEEKGIQYERIESFFKSDSDSIEQMLEARSIDVELLLKWCKLLKYDFFRLYSHHLQLYSVPENMYIRRLNNTNVLETGLPKFRKQLYTKEIIYFILELIQTNQKTKKQIIEEYKIPKTTLYKWVNKYSTK